MPVLHREGLGYAPYLEGQLRITIIEHINYEGEYFKEGVLYRFFRSGKGFFHRYTKTINYIKKEQPDFLFVQGLIFPFQVILLRLKVGKKVKFIVQHHGGKPFGGIKKIFQRIADRYIDAYVFTASGNATEWIEKGVIKNESKIKEILEGSTWFEKRDKQACRKRLNISGNPLLLWVGRLHTNKDPITVLRGFKKYVEQEPSASLYMIFGEDGLVAEVKAYIFLNGLQDAVKLVGKIGHADLPDWYSAADLFISGSLSEGSGYALLEAMACGCVPVVTNIPSFKKITGEGHYGYLFEPGDENGLLDTLIKVKLTDLEAFSEKIRDHFKQELSFSSIARKLFKLCAQLTAE